MGGDLDSGVKLDRNTQAQRCAGVKACGTGYDGGHLIARHLGGAGDKINLVPMTTKLNRSEFRAMEIYLGKQLDEGKGVTIAIEVFYPDNPASTRPSNLRVEAVIDGVSEFFDFNQ